MVANCIANCYHAPIVNLGLLGLVVCQALTVSAQYEHVLAISHWQWHRMAARFLHQPRMGRH